MNARATASTPRPGRYEVRAVWRPDPNANYTRSQPIHDFDRRSMEPRVPDAFGVYVVCLGWIEDHDERAQAEKHCAELNGVQS